MLIFPQIHQGGFSYLEHSGELKDATRRTSQQRKRNHPARAVLRPDSSPQDTRQQGDRLGRRQSSTRDPGERGVRQGPGADRRGRHPLRGPLRSSRPDVPEGSRGRPSGREGRVHPLPFHGLALQDPGMS